MSWTATRTAISALIEAEGFERSEELFDIEKLPSSLADKAYCIQLDEMEENKDGFGSSKDRFFPTQKLRISIIYEVYNNSQAAYDTAVDFNSKAIKTLIDPSHRSGDIRMISFKTSRQKYFKNEGNWLIIDNYFDMQVQITFPA